MTIQTEGPKIQELRFEDLLGKPALLKSEDGRDYERLRAAIEREMDPKSIFDKIRVQDLTNKVWEERRLKRSQAALIECALVYSLAMLFAPLLRRDFRSPA